MQLIARNAGEGGRMGAAVMDKAKDRANLA
jgi:hypothetical protein